MRFATDEEMSAEELIRVYFEHGGEMAERGFFLPFLDGPETTTCRVALFLLMLKHSNLLDDLFYRFSKGEVDINGVPIVNLKKLAGM